MQEGLHPRRVPAHNSAGREGKMLLEPFRCGGCGAENIIDARMDIPVLKPRIYVQDCFFLANSSRVVCSAGILFFAHVFFLRSTGIFLSPLLVDSSVLSQDVTRRSFSSPPRFVSPPPLSFRHASLSPLLFLRRIVLVCLS